MEQVLESLQSQIAQQHETLSSLSDSIVRLMQAVTHTAGTSDAAADALVRLPFLNDRLKSVEAAAGWDQSRWRTLNREIGDLRQMITDANDAVHRRIGDGRSTSLGTMGHLDKGFTKFRDLVSIRHGQA